MNIRFSEYKPSPALQNPVQTYWRGDFNLYAANEFEQSVVPNGCVELIVHLTGNHCELIKTDRWGRTPEFLMIGLQTSPYRVRFNKRVEVFGIRFNPEGLYSIFGLPPAIIAQTFENSSELLGRVFNEYCLRLRECSSAEEQVALTDDFLFKEFSKRKHKSDYWRLAPQIIRKYRGMLSMRDLFREVPISQRQLQREFKSKFGITAKEYMRLSRLNAIQKYMRNEKVSLSGLTYETEFSDQAHFIREFRSLTGINPRGFLRQRTDFIVNPAETG